jgi:ferritin-like metal-binding protein YciE
VNCFLCAYGSSCAFGKQLGFSEGVKLLEDTMEEGKALDLKLTGFAEKAGNTKASSA